MKEENLFRLYRKRAGYSQKEVSEALHVTVSAVSSWESGRYTPDPQNLKALADLFGVTVDALLGRDANAIQPNWQTVGEPQAEDLSPETVLIPAVGRVRAGWDGIAEQDIVGYFEIEKAMQNRFHDLFKMDVYGDSMEPEIHDGDIAIVHKCDAVESGAVAVVCVNGNEGTIKRVIINEDSIELVPTNTKYGRMKYTAEQVNYLPVTICGEVVEVRHRYK